MPSGFRHSRRILNNVLQLIDCLEDELGVDPLINESWSDTSTTEWTLSMTFLTVSLSLLKE